MQAGIMNHIVLLGDSVFDNAAYVDGGLDVTRHLRNRTPPGWEVTLKAVDGSIVQDVHQQADDLPPQATHLILSVGGNDALGKAGILGARAQSAAEVLDWLASAGEEFEDNYHRLLLAVLASNIPTAICTIYYPRFPDRRVQRLAVTALTVFNDVIIREAFMAGVPLLDLRLICDRDEDYANPIEPSEVGGGKIAAAIVRLLGGHVFERGRTEVFV
jgi:lysophospholipase L1-like esterase